MKKYLKTKDLVTFTFTIHKKHLSIVKRKQKKLSKKIKISKQKLVLKKNKQSKAKKRIDEKRVKKSNARYTIANIDSLNLNSAVLPSIFKHNKNYRIECLKNKSKYDTGMCKKYFGDNFLNETKEGRFLCPFVEIDAIHYHEEIVFPMKLHARNKNSPTAEFAGLRGYNEKEFYLKMALQEVSPYVQDAIIKRIDIAIDFNNRVQSKVHNGLIRTRIARKKGHTTYYKTPNEGKTNHVVNILIYDKGKKENLSLDKRLLRLEYQFKSPYIGKVMLKDIDRLIAKIEKRINKDTGLNIRVSSLLS